MEMRKNYKVVISIPTKLRPSHEFEIMQEVRSDVQRHLKGWDWGFDVSVECDKEYWCCTCLKEYDNNHELDSCSICGIEICSACSKDRLCPDCYAKEND